MKAEILLPDMLDVAVPVWIDEIRDWSPRARMARARECVRRWMDAPNGGAELLHGGCKRGESATAFNRLAQALACAAYQRGGIRFAGLHWCAQHHPAGVHQSSMVCDECVVEEEAS